VTEQEYRAHPAICQSDLKAMLDCEAAWQAGWRRKTTVDMLVGQVFEAEVCDDSEARDRLAKDERCFTKATKNQPARLYADFAIVPAMVAAWRRQPAWVDAETAEQQSMWFGVLQTPAGPVEVKGKGDLFHRALALMQDIKSAKNFADEWINNDSHPWLGLPAGRRSLVPWWQVHGYELQAAHYLALLALNDVVGARFELCAVSKESPPDVAWVDLGETDSAGRIVRGAAVRAAAEWLPYGVARAAALRQGAVATACGRCEWCREGKVVYRAEVAA